MVAYAVLAGIRENGLDVPADVAVIGVDNDPIGSLLRPSLSTIDTGHVELGDQLAQLIQAALNDESAAIPPASHQLRLVLRDSAP